MSYRTSWAAGNIGHVAEHNAIGARLNATVLAFEHGVGAGASAAANTAGISAAIARAVSLGGGGVLLPPGVLPISEGIALPNGVTLTGSGMGVTKLRADAVVPGGMVQLKGSVGAHRQYAGVECLSLYCAGNAAYGVELDYAIYTCAVRHVFVQGAAVAGVFTGEYNTFGCLLDFLSVYQCARGIHLGLGANAMRITNSNVRENTGAGLYMDTPAACLISGTTLEKNGGGGIEQAGVVLHGGNGCSFESCYFEGNGVDAGVDIRIEPGSLNTPHGTVVQGCYFNGLDTKAAHAITTDAADVVMLGGQSVRHAGVTLVETNGGSVTDIGASSLDGAGLR